MLANMAKVRRSDFYQGSLFEEDYLVRTLGAIAQSPDSALTELVANAWDAGASYVDISIPEAYEEVMTIGTTAVECRSSNSIKGG